MLLRQAVPMRERVQVLLLCRRQVSVRLSYAQVRLPGCLRLWPLCRRRLLRETDCVLVLSSASKTPITLYSFF